MSTSSNSNEVLLRVGKIIWPNKIPHTNGYKTISVHPSNKIGGGLSPYTLKDDKGRIMENAYQFQKIYPKVYAQKQKHWLKSMDGIYIWVHPEEIHIDENGNPTKEYWAWRKKGMNNKYNVRYPNGRTHASECVGAYLKIGTKNGKSQYELLDYIESRKRIYAKLYIECAKKHPQFQQLKDLIAGGNKLQICEADGPKYTTKFPFNQVVDGSMPITEENVKAWLHDPSQPFGHGVCLCVALLGKEEWLE
jgi:hypothetical protein